VTPPVRAGVAGLAGIGASLVFFLATALLGPSAMQPSLPGTPGLPPYSLDTHPSPYLVIGLVAAGVLVGAAGLGLCLYAVRGGWSCRPRPLLIAGLLVAAAFVFLPPVGSGDHLNYAAYGRMAVTGHDPYDTAARDLPGDPIAGAVESPWREEPSIYGPIATGQEALASWIGGDSVRLTVFVLSLTNAMAFALAGLVLYRTSAGGRLRSVLLWTGNPLLLFHLVSGAHNDVLAIAAAVCALAVFRASSTPRSLASGALVGAGIAIKLPAGLVGGGPAWTLFRKLVSRRPGGEATSALCHGDIEEAGRGPRSICSGDKEEAGISGTRGLAYVAMANARRRIALLRLVALSGAALAVAVAGYTFAGAHAFDQVRRASRSVSLATPWHLLDVALGKGSQRPIIQALSLLLLAGLAVLLARALPGDRDDRRVAAALVIAWLFATPYALPWYDGLGWALLALLPWSAFDALMLARTVALSLAYLPARDPQVVRLPDHLSWLFTVVRPSIIPWALTAILVALVWVGLRRRTGRARRPAPDLVHPPRA
jgi:hypothetical protein